MKKHIPGIIFTIILTGLLGILSYQLYRSQLLPTKLFVLLTTLLFLVLLLTAILLWSTKYTVRFVFGCILLLVLSVGSVLGIHMLSNAIDTMGNILDNRVENVHIGVYVLADNSATSIEDAKNYLFGVLVNVDEDSVSEAISEVESKLNTNIKTIYYDRMVDLASALRGGDCDAIVVNTALIELLSESEEFSGFSSQVKELSTIIVEHVIETRPQSTKPNTSDIISSDIVEDNVFTVYISGIDAYGDISTRSRSDVNILAVINTLTHQVLLLSTPRDYYVQIGLDGYPYDKLTHAGLYGVQCSMDTLSMLYESDVDYYFRVNFTGFEEIIDALGGITVYSEYSFSVRNGMYYYDVGYNDMDGARALAFARERYSFSDGDNQRGKNQMEVIKATIKKMLSPSILSNFTGLLDALEGSFSTSVPYDVLSALVQNQLDTSASWDIISYSVNGTGNSKQTYSSSDYLYVMDPDWDTVYKAIDLIERMENNEYINID